MKEVSLDKGNRSPLQSIAVVQTEISDCKKEIGTNADTSYSSSIVIVGILNFVGDATRGILNPVLWALCKVN
jgi:hypothetical protein